MSVYEEHHDSFSFWESNLATFTSRYEGEPADEEEITPADLELAQLQFAVAAIRRQLQDLGVERAASMHSWEADEVRHVVYLSRTFPVGKKIPKHLSYARVLTNEIRRTEHETRIADTAEYFLDLREDNYAIASYEGQAIDDGFGLRLRPGSPPLAIRQGLEVLHIPAVNYNPNLPPTLHGSSPIDALNSQRTEAGLVLDLLEKIGEGTEDLQVPYES
jgi:hypothetical protein